MLRPGGRLVAATNSLDHLGELWRLVGRDRWSEPERFFAETGEAALRPHFARIERRDVEGRVVFEDTAAARHYVESSVAHKHLADRVPELDEPLVVRIAQQRLRGGQGMTIRAGRADRAQARRRGAVAPTSCATCCSATPAARCPTTR